MTVRLRTLWAVLSVLEAANAGFFSVLAKWNEIEILQRILNAGHAENYTYSHLKGCIPKQGIFEDTNSFAVYAVGLYRPAYDDHPTQIRFLNQRFQIVM
jgi:hypothetical protein